MKPADTYTGYRTFDLTVANVHVLANDDGSKRVVARYPKTWTKGDRIEGLSTVNGLVDMCPHDVTEWAEVVLATIPAPAPAS